MEDSVVMPVPVQVGYLPIETWHDAVRERMEVAARMGVRFGLKQRQYIDECVAEAYFLTTLWVLKYTKKQPHGDDFDPRKNLSMFIYRGLQDYFKYNKPKNITDVLGENWKDRYSELTAFVSLDTAVRELLDGLVQNERELSVLMMKADGYNSKQIAAALNFDVLSVRRILNKIEFMLSFDRVPIGPIGEDD